MSLLLALDLVATSGTAEVYVINDVELNVYGKCLNRLIADKCHVIQTNTLRKQFQFDQSHFITTGVIIEYRLDGMMLDTFND